MLCVALIKGTDLSTHDATHDRARVQLPNGRTGILCMHGPELGEARQQRGSSRPLQIHAMHELCYFVVVLCGVY